MTLSKTKKKSKAKDFVTEFNATFGNLQDEFIDSHCHIDSILDRIYGDTPTTSNKCCEIPTGIKDNFNSRQLAWETYYDKLYLGNQPYSVTVCCDIDSYPRVMKLLDDDKTNKLRAAFGLHPHEAKHWNQDIEDLFVKAMSHPKVLAWGECGLDYYYDNSPRDIQKQCFIRQIQLAVEHKKPLVMHSRDAEEDTLNILIEYLPKKHVIHWHCCTTSYNLVEPLLKHFPNMYVGFTGCITFPSADINRNTVKNVPLNRLLLETDGPYMAPIPFRQEVAHPGMIPFVAQTMANIHEVDISTLLKQVRINTRNVYGI